MRADPRDDRLLEWIEELEASLGEVAPPLLPRLSDADALLRHRGLKDRKPGDLWTIAPDHRCPEGAAALLLITKITNDNTLLCRLMSLELALATDEELVLPASATPAREPLVIFGEEQYFRRGALRSPLGTIDDETLARVNAFFDRAEPARGEGTPDELGGIPLLSLDDSEDEGASFFTGLPIEDEDDLRLDARALFLEATRYLAPEHDDGAYIGSLDRLIALRSSEPSVGEPGSGNWLERARGLFDFGEAKLGLIANTHRDASEEGEPISSSPSVPIEARLGSVEIRCELHSDGEYISVQIMALRAADGAPAEGVTARLRLSIGGELLYEEERTTSPRGAIIPFSVEDNDVCHYELTLRWEDEELIFEW